jgi:hypothetical protein
MSQTDADTLAAELSRAGYRGLFVRPGARLSLEEIWNRPGVPEALLGLANDDARPWPTRFLAAEAVFNQEMFLIQPEHFAALAPVYAQALKENATGFMSDWGFMHGMDDPGRLGGRFVLFGPDAVAALRPLLEDATEVPFLYPPEFPSEMRFGLRLKDFAALYLGRICGVALRLTEDTAQRDSEIRRLKQLLP